MSRRVQLLVSLAVFAAALPACVLRAQPGAAEREALHEATLADYHDMLAQLGIKAMRPGASADASAPNSANYDEARANPYPNLPDPLTLEDGGKVTSAAMWRSVRRPEIVAAFEREVYGRVPKETPPVEWQVIEERRWLLGGRRVVGRQLVGRVDNSAYPAISVDICMSLVTPEDARGGVPVMIMLGGGTLPETAGRTLPETAGVTLPETRRLSDTSTGSSEVAAALSSCQRQAAFLARLAKRRSRRRSSGDRAARRRRLGLRVVEPDQHPGG